MVCRTSNILLKDYPPPPPPFPLVAKPPENENFLTSPYFQQFFSSLNSVNFYIPKQVSPDYLRKTFLRKLKIMDS